MPLFTCRVLSDKYVSAGSVGLNYALGQCLLNRRTEEQMLNGVLAARADRYLARAPVPCRLVRTPPPLPRQQHYAKGFIVSSGKNSELGYNINLENTFSCLPPNSEWSYGQLESDSRFSFCKVGDVAGTYVWNDTRSLEEIAQITGFSVKPAFPSPIRAEGIQLGDYFAGGTVFYLDPSGKHGLVVSPIEIGMGSPWGCGNFAPKTSTEFGTGAENTKIVVSECEGTAESDIAAKICTDLVANGYDDWFLPSYYEIKKIKENLHGFPLFGIYWSSSSSGRFEAYILDGTSGGRGYWSKSDTKRITILPVRAF